MPRSTRATENDPSLNEEWVDHIIHRAAIAAILLDPKVAEPLLEIPDAALGRTRDESGGTTRTSDDLPFADASPTRALIRGRAA